MTDLLCPIQIGSLHTPTQVAIRTESSRLSYAQLDQCVSKIVHHLTVKKVVSGQKVAFIAHRNIQVIALIFAILRIGAIAVPMSPKAPVNEQFKLLDFIHPDLILWDGPLLETDYPVYPISILDEDILELSDSPPSVLTPNQPAVLIRTSGTSGDPKFALLSFGNLYYSALGINEALTLHSDDAWLLTLPLHHVSGLGILCRCFIKGACVTIPDSDDLLSNVLRYNITQLSLVPTQLQRLMKHPLLSTYGWSWRSVMVSGAEIAPRLVSDARQLGIPVVTAYGLTEMGSAVTMGFDDTDAGTVLPYRKIRMGPNNSIEVCGHTLFLGYLKSNSYVSLPLTIDGWFSTGDIGIMQGNRWTIVGRADDMMISGGENIHPGEIESVIRHLFNPNKVLVVPVPHPEYGQRPIVLMEPVIDYAMLKNELKEYLPSFAIPDAIYPWRDEIELEIKINRRKLGETLK